MRQFPAPPPVPDGTTPPTEVVMVAERHRLATELMYAIERHRKGWRTMIDVKAAYVRQHGEGVVADRAAEEDTRYKVALADVKFWREEQTAAATALAAIEHYLESRRDRLDSKYDRPRFPGTTYTPPRGEQQNAR